MKSNKHPTKYPTSDEAREAFMLRVLETAASDAVQGRYFLNANRDGEVSVVLHVFAAAQAAVDEATARVRSRRRAAKKAVARMRNAVQKAWKDLRWQVNWEKLDTVIYSHYQLTQDGNARAPRLDGEWVVVVGKVLEGDATAIAEGYSGLSNRHELEDAHIAASALLREEHDADVAEKAARRAVQAARHNVDTVCRKVVSDLRNNLRELSDPSRRQVMRTYGVRFKGDEALTTPAADDAQPQDGSAVQASTAENTTASESNEIAPNAAATPYAAPSAPVRNGTVGTSHVE